MKFNFLHIQVKFCDDSFIGCEQIRENAVHWLKLAVSQNAVFGGVNGGQLTLERK